MPNDAKSRFRNALERGLQERNWSLADLERASGLGYSTLRRYRLGERTPNVEDLEKIARAFDVSAELLLGALSPEAVP